MVVLSFCFYFGFVCASVFALTPSLLNFGQGRSALPAFNVHALDVVSWRGPLLFFFIG